MWRRNHPDRRPVHRRLSAAGSHIIVHSANRQTLPRVLSSKSCLRHAFRKLSQINESNLTSRTVGESKHGSPGVFSSSTSNTRLFLAFARLPPQSTVTPSLAKRTDLKALYSRAGGLRCRCCGGEKLQEGLTGRSADSLRTVQAGHRRRLRGK